MIEANRVNYHCQAHNQYQHGCVGCYTMLKRYLTSHHEVKPKPKIPPWLEWGLLVILGLALAAMLVMIVTVVELLNALRGLTS